MTVREDNVTESTVVVLVVVPSSAETIFINGLLSLSLLSLSLALALFPPTSIFQSPRLGGLQQHA